MTMDDNVREDATDEGRSYRSRIGLLADSPQFPSAWRDVVEKVKLADELGFASIWLGESWGYELFTSMMDLVHVTKRIKIGAGIANIYSRTPALIASAIATLDERSGGRIVLGLGPSGAQVIEHWHGVPFDRPLARTREYVQIIRMILREEKLVYRGSFFHLERGFKLRFHPLRADVPIYIAAMGPRSIVQAGEIADGVLPIYWPATRWPDLRQQLDVGSLLAHRPAHSTLIAPYIPCAVLPVNASEDERRAVFTRVAAPLAYYIGKMGKFYAEMLSRNGFKEDVSHVLEAWQHGMKSAIAAVSPRLVEETMLVGTAPEIVAKLDQWVASGVDEPLLSMPEGTIDETAAQLSALKDALAL